MRAPDFKIEIIHIDGPSRGIIQEFRDDKITIGRHPDCQVRFPADMTTISRVHAEIRREGNRFLLLDQSTNGTMLNGKNVSEATLKDGDVLTIAENGPKISFLATRIENENQQDSQPPPEIEVQPEPSPPITEEKQVPRQVPEPAIQTEEPAQSGPGATPEPQITATQFIIQYGPSIKSFSQLPITIGSSEESDFSIRHNSLMPQHAQIFFHNGGYNIRDLTGKGALSINGRPVEEQAQIPPDTCVALSQDGPFFQFLGEGRLAEIDMADAASAGRDKQNVPKPEKPKSLWPFKK